jgi:hypothetical protein
MWGRWMWAARWDWPGIVFHLILGMHRYYGAALLTLAKATYVNSYRGGPLLYTHPPGVTLNRLELKKQMRYVFCAKTFCVLQKNVLGIL